MFEQSKAAKRRFYDGNFHNRYFKGSGIDIGGKPDPFSQYIGVFPLISDVKIWDLEDGDAQYMISCPDEMYDFLVSSHCLEHMVDVYEAFSNWLRIVKNGGYLVITVPDEDMYEQEIWPSNYNADHKWTFTINKTQSWSLKSINIVDLLRYFSNQIEIEKIHKISDFYNTNLTKVDQTLHPNIESSIEIIIKKSIKNIPFNVLENKNIQNRFWLTNESTIQTIEFAQYYSKIFNEISLLKNNNDLYIIYGYGSFGKTIASLLNTQIKFFIDIDSSMQNGINIQPLDVLDSANLHGCKIIISTLGREDEVCNKLINKYGVLKNQIIRFDSLLLD